MLSFYQLNIVKKYRSQNLAKTKENFYHYSNLNSSSPETENFRHLDKVF